MDRKEKQVSKDYQEPMGLTEPKERPVSSVMEIRETLLLVTLELLGLSIIML